MRARDLTCIGAWLLTACAAPPRAALESGPGGAGSSAMQAAQKPWSAAVSGSPAPATEGLCTPGIDDTLPGCPCAEPGASTACWTGPAALRHTGQCRDGTQVCSAEGQEFARWGPCMGEQLDCGMPGGCPCVPGAVLNCDEDCTVNLFCTLTAEKVCLPDGTWGPCRETSPPVASVSFDGGVPTPEDLARIQSEAIARSERLLSGCWSRYHGCLNNPWFPNLPEQFTGDCSKQFTCGHAPQ
jgi:hypothetical protein